MNLAIPTPTVRQNGEQQQSKMSMTHSVADLPLFRNVYADPEALDVRVPDPIVAEIVHC